MQNSLKKSESFTIRTLLLAHFFISSIGLLVLVKYIASWIAGTILGPLNIFISYTDWAILSTAPSKPAELLQYGLSVPSLAVYYMLALFFIRNFSDVADNVFKRIGPNKILLYGYFILLLLLNIALLKARSPLIFILMAAWFVFLIWPALPSANAWLDRIILRSGLWSTALLVTLIASLGFAFYPYIKGGFPVSNDYMDIPEQTILLSGVVDNTDYINRNNIGGLYKHDPRISVDEQKFMQEGLFILLKDSVALSKFISKNSKAFVYDEANQVLIPKGLMTEDDRDNLVRIADDETERGRIHDFYANQVAEAKTRKNYSTEQIEFIQKNRRGFLDQALAGHYFHHQNTMLGTINEYVLEKPQNQTVFLYGWLSTVVIAETMEALGGISFESYQQVFYSFYPAYYLLLLAVAAIIFKNKGYVLLVGLISIGSLYLIEFETIRFAPGFNPIRHFFDIFALLCFYWHLFASRRNLFFLAAALGFSIIGILFSKEFGLALLLAMLATVVIRSVIERRKAWPEFLLLAIAVLIALASFILVVTGKNPTLLYVLLGVATPTMNSLKTYGLLLLFSVFYILLIKNRKPKDNWSYLSFFWFLYAQGLLIYYVWNPAPNHLWSLGSVWGMSLVLLLRYSSANYDWMAQWEKKILLVSNFLFGIFLFLPSVSSYYLHQRDYQKVFEVHTVHNWDFPRAKFSSTMDPGVFKNAIDLIHKYSNGNSIYILSKYDNILPFLSEKYSAMPFTEVALSLVTQKEIDKSTDLIRHDRPEYLFVDSDMTRGHFGDVFKWGDPVSEFAAPVHEASMGRALVLDNFAKIFKEISPLYEPIEAGQLITVYRRRSGT